MAILAEYHKVIKEFECLGDCAEHIAHIAQSNFQSETAYSEAALRELGVLEEVIEKILAYTEHAFAKRNIESAYHIEPLVEVVNDIVRTAKENHLKRMSSGECNVYSDASYSNLLSEMKRIADGCSNVGSAIVVRVRPELADQEHLYYSRMRSGKNKRFNEEYDQAYEDYVVRVLS